MSIETNAARPADPGLEALVTLLHLQGVAADAGQIRHRLGTDKIGASEMLRCARDLGLKARAYRTDWSRLGSTPLPAIASLRDGGLLLLAKTDGDRVLVQSPLASRPVLMTLDELAAVWDGQLILTTNTSASPMPRITCFCAGAIDAATATAQSCELLRLVKSATRMFDLAPRTSVALRFRCYPFRASIRRRQNVPQVYFHCSNPKEVLIDRSGAVVDDLAEARDQAACVVRSLTTTRSLEDWRGWILHVDDDLGDELFVVPFAFVLGKPH